MSGRYLLDTNIVIATFSQDAAVAVSLSAASEVFVPSIVIGELYFGAYKSTRVQDNLKRTTEFIAANTVLVCDSATAQFYGQIKNALKLKGRPIPENDMRIAAVGMQYDLILASRDAHFSEINGLKLEAW
jgi:tRNA(fMet)-specific endonuclease VapC